MNERRREVSKNTGWGFWGEEGLFFPLSRAETKQLVRAALEEDDTTHDVTTIATVLSDRRARCRLVARQAGVIAGIPLAAEAFRQIDPSVTIRIDHEDGEAVEANTLVMYLSGHARGLLSAERVALNFLQRLCGVASLTAKYVAAVKGTGARILDTRKTTPLWRKLEKYAVRAGGGLNHRMDLAAAVLMKDNHIAAIDGDIALGIKRAKEISRPGTKIEVECDTLEQVNRAVSAGADIVLLDNMPPSLIREAVLMVSGRAILEASGGVNLETVRAIAETGVDWISVGALTHSAPSLDLALDFE
jgi:nicotinate-nucleotide pyrophosphorylase (carboxylating)